MSQFSVFSYINQIFYPHKKFDDALEELEPWMLTFPKLSFANITASKMDIVEQLPDSLNKSSDMDPNAVSKKYIFTPKQIDSLFWSAYVIHKGEAEYTMIGSRYKNAEIEEKQKMIDFMKTHSDTIKSSFKLSAVKMKEIMSELMMDTKTSWPAFLVMTVYYKINAIVCYKQTFLEFKVKGAEHTHLFHRSEAGHVTVDLTPLEESDIQQIYDTRVSLGQNPEKPLKAASSYKMEDLEELADKIGVDPGNSKWKKADWYAAISKELEW